MLYSQLDFAEITFWRFSSIKNCSCSSVSSFLSIQNFNLAPDFLSSFIRPAIKPSLRKARHTPFTRAYVLTPTPGSRSGTPQFWEGLATQKYPANLGSCRWVCPSPHLPLRQFQVACQLHYDIY